MLISLGAGKSLQNRVTQETGLRPLQEGGRVGEIVSNQTVNFLRRGPVQQERDGCLVSKPAVTYGCAAIVMRHIHRAGKTGLDK
jgi:hypothetical protein